jgi:hypothetical protein
MKIELKFRALRSGKAVLGSHVAAQRVFENREEESNFAAQRLPARTQRRFRT